MTHERRPHIRAFGAPVRYLFDKVVSSCRRHSGQVLAQSIFLVVHLYLVFDNAGRTITLYPYLFGIPAAVVYGLVLLGVVAPLGWAARWLTRRVRRHGTLLNRVLRAMPLVMLTAFTILLYMPFTFVFADFCVLYDAACEPKSLSTYWFFWAGGALALWRFEVVSRRAVVHRGA